MQSFLYLNPNIVGDPDNGLNFLGARTYGATYIQDGQPSTGGFGSITNSAPGLDAISEVKVLSNSSSAEYGGLAGVIVTTRRGTNAFSGTGFFDVNNDALNARPYGQTLAGLERSDPLLDTHIRRYGATVGGPIAKDRTFFLLNYEGSSQAQVGGGTTITVPTDAMRSGDFSATTLRIVDPGRASRFPATGSRPLASTRRPRTSSTSTIHTPIWRRSRPAWGAPGTDNLDTTRNRWDARVDHELSSAHSVFLRVSDQRRNPGTSFEQDRISQSRGAGPPPQFDDGHRELERRPRRHRLQRAARRSESRPRQSQEPVRRLGRGDGAGAPGAGHGERPARVPGLRLPGQQRESGRSRIRRKTPIATRARSSSRSATP